MSPRHAALWVVIALSLIALLPVARADGLSGRWGGPALAGAVGLGLGALAMRESGAGRQEAGCGRQGAPHGADGPTERGTRQLDGLPQPSYRLVVWAGERRLAHELRERQCVIGRDPGCDLQIAMPSVAELHARLSLAGGRVTLTDLGSGGGTTLGPGGPRLPAHQPTEIQEGDEIWVGPEVRIALRRAEAGY
jgi:hypothetical protein